jgi:hypothetical protein
LAIVAGKKPGRQIRLFLRSRFELQYCLQVQQGGWKRDEYRSHNQQQDHLTLQTQTADGRSRRRCSGSSGFSRFLFTRPDN